LSAERVSKRLHSVRLHQWYASKGYNYEISFDIMISFTKLTTFQQGVIFDYYRHIGETIVETMLRNEHKRYEGYQQVTQKCKKRKDDKHKQVSTIIAGHSITKGNVLGLV